MASGQLVASSQKSTTALLAVLSEIYTKRSTLNCFLCQPILLTISACFFVNELNFDFFGSHRFKEKRENLAVCLHQMVVGDFAYSVLRWCNFLADNRSDGGLLSGLEIFLARRFCFLHLKLISKVSNTRAVTKLFFSFAHSHTAMMRISNRNKF
ncbi:hypothetical protein T10_9721 [Trichinella papuae]|uniref:Uncharacterized protein n=1 Tax=Trichinella papuae TaxID=268474 RepID=A0A0V1MRY6_9BILA|nr:hypothetical protein T10_9721 [Trichinella papuae]